MHNLEKVQFWTF